MGRNIRDVELNLIGKDRTGQATRSAGNNFDQLERKLDSFNASVSKKMDKSFGDAGVTASTSFKRKFFSAAKSFGATAKVIGGSWAVALGAVFVARAGTYMSAFAPLAIGILGAIPIAVLAKTDKVTQRALKGLKSKLMSFLKDVSAPVRPGLLRAIEIIESKLKRIKGPVTRLFKAIGDALPSLSKGAMGALENLLNAIGTDSVRAGLKEWGRQLPGIAKGLGKMIGAILRDPDKTVQTVRDVASDLTQLADSAGKIIGFLNRTARGWDRLRGGIDRFEKATSGKGGPLGGMYNAVKRNVPRIISKIAELPNKARNATRPMEAKISAVMQRTMTRASTAAKNLVSRVSGFLRALPGRAGSAVSGLWGRMSGAFSRAASAARGAASRIISAFIGLLRSLPSKAAAAVSGVGSAISSRLSGFISNARSQIGGLASKLGFSDTGGSWQFALAGGNGSRVGGPPQISVAAPDVSTRVFIDGRELRPVIRTTVTDENKRAAWRARTGAR